MADWFIFNGVNSRLYGVHVAQYPPTTVARERVEFVTIPGRSGSLTVTEGDAVYEDISLSLTCFADPGEGIPKEELVVTDDMGATQTIDIPKKMVIVDKPSLTFTRGSNGVPIPDISKWLRGSGRLIMGDHPDFYYEARVVNQISFEKVLRNHDVLAFGVEFRCKPYRYRWPVAATDILKNSGDTIINYNNVYAEPILRVNGSGDITLTLASDAGNTYVTNLSGVSSNIVLDVPAKMAYKGTLLQTHRLSGDWPRLDANAYTTVSWTGNVTRVRITPNWRDV